MRNTGEIIKPTLAVKAQSVTAASTLFNDAAAAVDTGIDTVDYDGAIVELSTGESSGDGTLVLDIVESDTDDSNSVTQVPGSAFAEVNNGANENKLQLGFINLEGRKRFIWARAVKVGTGAVEYGVNIILGEGKKFPEVNSLVFDIENP